MENVDGPTTSAIAGLVANRLRGHNDTVVCCEFDVSGRLLATGSEDSSVRVFDMTSHSCCQVYDGKFGQDDVSSVCFSTYDDNILYTAAGTSIYAFDTRKAGGGGDAEPIQTYRFNEEEITQIAINKKGNFMAAADESGDIRVIDLRSGGLYKTLRRGHSNICSSVQFHPKRQWEIISGGLDSKIIKWDFSTGRLKKCWDMSDEATMDETTPGKLCNPPLVQAIAVCSSDDCGNDGGSLLAAGRGDGSVVLYDLDMMAATETSSNKHNRGGGGGGGGGGNSKYNNKPGGDRATRRSSKAVDGRRDATTSGMDERDLRSVGGDCALRGPRVGHIGSHASSVSHVVFGNHSPPGQFLISGGNDKCVRLWGLKKTSIVNLDRSSSSPTSATTPSTSTSSFSVNKSCGKTAELGENEVDGSESSLVLTVRHKKKINWLATRRSASGNLAVADTSSIVTLYSLPS